MQVFLNVSLHFLFTLTLGFYLIQNLQWYNYKLSRVIFHHIKFYWHIFYFVIPVIAYYTTGKFFWIYFIFAYLPMLFLWYRRLDKKLVLTGRVKRFFLFLSLAILFGDILCLKAGTCVVFGVFLPLFAAYICSLFFEKIIFEGFKREAKRKLEKNNNLKIVAITASYGKTSIKNFLYFLLEDKFKVYKTPRSVNTLSGILKDINESLPNDTQIYIVEAGARERGDIEEIARFLDEEYAIVGKIGSQHIEYFKTLENIRNTKMEILQSKRLKKAFIHTSANVKETQNINIFGNEIENIISSLDGIEFDLRIDGKLNHFEAPHILGDFNTINLTAAILMAFEFGMTIDEIKNRIRKIKGIEHRLQKIEANGKIIIDDSFNGNLEGMLSSYELALSYNKGSRVVVTPGVVESDKETNVKLARKIDEVFDLIIITGKVNAQILFDEIKKTRKIVLTDKLKLQETLAKETKAGDLILFSNDAPTFM